MPEGTGSPRERFWEGRWGGKRGLIFVPLSWQQRLALDGSQYKRDWMGFASGWEVGKWGSLGALGGHTSLKGERAEPRTMSGAVAGWEAWGTGRRPPPLAALTSPRASFPRNFRKHLRMVGSRRVKAQSKGAGWTGQSGWAALGRPASWLLAAQGKTPKAPPRPQLQPRWRLLPLAPSQGTD